MDKTYDINIEATILSTIIYSPTLLDKHLLKLSEELFFLPSHKKIFNVILDLYNQEKGIDEEIIKNRLDSTIEDEIIFILSKTPISNIDDYIEILKDFSIKRDIKRLTLEISNDLQENISGIEIEEKLKHLTSKIYQKNPVNILDIANINDIEDKDIKYICKSWLPIPKRTVSLITAPGGTGKSWLILQLAIRVAKEEDINKIFLWLSEDPKEVTKNRFNKILNNILKMDNDTIKDKIFISDSPTIQFMYEDQRKIEISSLFPHFKVMMQPFDLIVLDPLIAFYGADENNNSQARKFMQLFTDWANKEDKTIIFIHHSTKNTTQSRGASAFVDAVRTVYEVDKIKDDNGNIKDTSSRIIKLTKDNYGILKFLSDHKVQRVLFPPQIKYENYVENSLNIPDDF